MTARKPARRQPASWGTVEQLPSGRYRAFYRLEGMRFSAPSTFATKGEAYTWLASERADRARGNWRDPNAGKITLADYAATWLDAHPDLSPRTRDTYERSLSRWILPRLDASRVRVELGAEYVADLTPAAVRTWYAGVFAAARERASRRLAKSKQRRQHPARVWARARGYEVADTGRLSPEIMAAYRAAGEPVPAHDDASTATPPTNAGKTTAAHAYRVLRTILNTAVEDGLLQTNPCKISGGGVVHHRERTTASPAEVAELTTLVPPEFAAAVMLAAWSSLRYGELFALARRHVDLEAGVLRVERALVCVPGKPIEFGKTKTTKSNRTVNLPAFVTEALRAHLAEHVASSRDALLFSMDDGTPVTTARVSFIFRRARRVIGRDDLTWHDLRHTGATLAYRAGASVPEVQARLGHSTMRAALIYAHTADDSDKVLADRLDTLYADSVTTARKLRAV